ncbi:hypothetical protein SAMN05444266_101470 [Chitinophaga jiangningensis]|uniref:Lipocalin-like domain-containing protein n=1 Tax=Chitinophaga jiangningensis TaxID=1419482 RepID=A0A1M6W3E1_9BACT|nr:hypothetical protein [Chitinophaga jiangningensis]SHK88284.1 hypothetical protein SAMN05444266_101470 [Chitinophaga jiangningensis]
MHIRTLFTALCTMLLFASCSNNDDDVVAPPVDPNAPSSGTWKVAQFSERNEDHTSEFNGYTFTFSSTGTASALKGSVTANGTWSITNNSARFNIDFGAKSDANKPLGELTDDWRIISVSSTRIQLTDDNTSSAEVLTFTKI